MYLPAPFKENDLSTLREVAAIMRENLEAN